MNQVQIFDGLKVKEENGHVMFDAETVAIGVGITTFATSGKTYVRWSRVNKYLGIDTSVDEPIKRGDWITESQMYTLAIKAENAVATRFQNWVTEEVLPSIRKTGKYEVPSQDFFLIESAEEIRKAQEAKNARNIAMSRNSITKQARLMFDVAASTKDDYMKERLLHASGDLLLRNVYL